jgi:hypothetical protein
MNKESLSRANIFPASRKAIENDTVFPWHKEAYKINSSQALAIDLFGYIQVSENRDIVLNELSNKLNTPSESPWEVKLEWSDPKNLLNEDERYPTQVDSILQNKKSLIFCECKFTEDNGGSCNQVKPFRSGPQKGLIQCNGRYKEQVNPYNAISSKCALSGKNIRYWEVIDDLFERSIYGHKKCPFSGSWYQWMRNITICSEVALDQGLKPGFLLVFADDSEFSVAKKVRSQEWTEFLNHIKPGKIEVTAISYQRILKIITDLNLSDHEIWLDLEQWVLSKINLSSIILKNRKPRKP